MRFRDATVGKVISDLITLYGKIRIFGLQIWLFFAEKVESYISVIQILLTLLS